MLQSSSSAQSPGGGAETSSAGVGRRARALVEVDPSLRAGDKLRAARLARSLSLDYVAEKTLLRKEHLEALEAMNVKLLPGKAFTLAYLAGYAEFLGLDAKSIVQQFKSECALTREDAQPQLRDPESKPRRERPWLAAAAVALVAASFVGFKAYKASQPDSRLVETEAAAPLAPPGAQAAAPPVLAPASVELRALTPAWLEVRGPDGTIFFSDTVQPGQAYRPDAGAGWTVHAADGGAFEVLVGGQVVGMLGEAGKPVLGRRVDSLTPETAAVSATAG